MVFEDEGVDREIGEAGGLVDDADAVFADGEGDEAEVECREGVGAGEGDVFAFVGVDAEIGFGVGRGLVAHGEAVLAGVAGEGEDLDEAVFAVEADDIATTGVAGEGGGDGGGVDAAAGGGAVFGFEEEGDAGG